jgi:hypothetical protein
MIEFERFKSPSHERSSFKSIHIGYLDSVKQILGWAQSKYRIRYRGPRQDASAAYCLKKDAKFFSIYFTADADNHQHLCIEISRYQHEALHRHYSELRAGGSI